MRSSEKTRSINDFAPLKQTLTVAVKREASTPVLLGWVDTLTGIHFQNKIEVTKKIVDHILNKYRET